VEFLRRSASTVSSALTLSETPERLVELARSSRADVIIGVGAPTLAILQAARLPVPLLAAAAPIVPGAGLSGLSTIAEPSAQLAVLARFAPAAKRVFVVHQPSDGWLIEIARRAAASRGMSLIALSATNGRDAAVDYLNTVRSMNSRTDALWLTSQPGVLTTELVQAIVEQAWNASALVYSSALEHVTQGVLFGTYPDPRRVAERVARMALAGSNGVQLDSQPNTAVNVRTATHLVSRLDMSLLAGFTIRFGER